MYDLIIIGAGSGGLTAAEFAARLGVKVAPQYTHYFLDSTPGKLLRKWFV